MKKNQFLKGAVKAGIVAILALTGTLTLSNRAAAQEQTKTIYFLAGLKDHVGGEGTGRHETRRDLLVLQHCIDSLTNVKGVKIKTKFLYGRTALNIDDLKDCAAIIVECSSVTSTKTTQTRTHPLIPPPSLDGKDYDKATQKYFSQIDSLQKAGMGIMILHWGIATDGAPNSVNAHYMQWFGQCALSGYTQNPLGYWSIMPIKAAEKHPILRGVQPWTYKDEIFSRLNVIPNDPHRTDLLMGQSEHTNQSEEGSPSGVISPRCVASAYENGLQRGVLWGGMDYHSALLNENYLRFVLNEILWTAAIEVPKGGAKTAAKTLQLSPIKPDGFDRYKPASMAAK